MTKWHIRLNQRLSELGWTKAELARRSDVSYERIIKYLHGDVDNPRGDVLEQIANAVGIPLKILLFGEDSKSNTQFQPVETNFIPLISMDDLSNAAFGKSFKKFLADVEETTAVDISVSQDSFGVILNDNSMLPIFKPGDVVVCDPDMDVAPGDLVFAKLDELKQVIFRRIRPKQADPKVGPVELAATNPDFPIVSIRSKKKGFVIGRGTQHIRVI